MLKYPIMTGDQKRIFRTELFQHLDGFASISCLYALRNRSWIDQLSEKEFHGVNEIAEKLECNSAYLNVCLRVFASQGWLEHKIDSLNEQAFYKLKPNGKIAFQMFNELDDVLPLWTLGMEVHQVFTNPEKNQLESLHTCIDYHKENWKLQEPKNNLEYEVYRQLQENLEGVLCGPILVELAMSGVARELLNQNLFRLENTTLNSALLEPLTDLMDSMGWLESHFAEKRLSEKGQFFLKRASAYGVTVSYLSTFAQIPELLFGNPIIFWDRPLDSMEIHVNRRMNVWGSGGAHSTYFKKFDEIIIDLFNKPLHEQPKGFLDMGSGNGALLEHIFDVIEKETLRGKQLESNPLFIVGADYNKAALVSTKETLDAADVWAKVEHGDVSDPEALAKSLKDKYNVELGDLLNMRTFLDHNRIYREPKCKIADWTSTSTGAFCFRGKMLKNTEVEQNLVEHLTQWTPFLSKFGLLIIELHTLPPETTANNMGRSGITAYDATHGFSDQYIVEYDVFMKCAQRAGLNNVPKYATQYPSKELATVSINLFKACS